MYARVLHGPVSVKWGGPVRVCTYMYKGHQGSIDMHTQ